MHCDVPAIWRHRIDDLTHILVRHRHAEMRKMKMQADTAHASVVEPFDLRGRRIGLEQGNTAITPPARGEEIEQDGMIAAVAGRMHEHTALKAEKIMEPEQILLGGVGRREWPVRGIGKFAVRAEDVEMRVA